MATQIRVPSVGESINEVMVARWLKDEGSWVAADEPVVSLETDKANVEVPAPVAGRLTRILKGPNSTAGIGEVLGEIEAGAPDAKSEVAPAPQPAAKPAVEAAPAAAPPAAKPAPPAPPPPPPAPVAAVPRPAPVAPPPPPAPAPVAPRPTPPPAPTPAPAPAAARPTPAPPAPARAGERPERVVPMTPLRRRIAERLVQAQHTAAMLTTFNEVDMTAVIELRRRHQEAFQRRHGIKLGFMSFFVKAAVAALQQMPELNAEIRGTDVVYHGYYDVCVAVSTDRGLVVPVIRNAEALSFAKVEHTIADFAVRAREARLRPDELQGGTFTITNGGVFGSLLSTPILNPPQTGILGMHSIQERGVGVNGRLELRPMMYLALTYDHRLIDGAGAVTFLRRIKEYVEEPARLLVDA